MRKLIAWLYRRAKARRSYGRQRVVTFDGKFLFYRFTPFWDDEWIRNDGKHYNRPPWWRPFNVLLHNWRPDPGTQEGFHDHPRWSITVCLRGGMIEHTPWKDKILHPGSIVVRGRKYIHAFSVPPEHRGRTWTLFVVGRRNYRQNSYKVTKE